MKILSFHLLLFYSCCFLGEAGDLEKKQLSKTVEMPRGALYWLLGQACWTGDEVGVRMLLNAGADIDGVSDYKLLAETGFGIEPSWPLNHAAAAGHTKIVKLLLEKGAKVDNREGDGGSYTALTFAVSGGHEEVVKMLVEAGAERGIRLSLIHI